MSEPIRTDVLVVGAGPAGSSAAHHLAAAGLEVLLVDRAAFPREKVCGDGLTPRAAAALVRMGVDVTDPGFVPVRRVRTYGSGLAAVEFDWPGGPFPPIGLMRPRIDLDQLLVERATAAGARFMPTTRAERPLVDGAAVSGATIRREDGAVRQVSARFVLAADGASSRFAAHAGVRRIPGAPVAVAARGYVRSSRSQEPVFEAFLTLRDGRRYLPGYGWVFPAGDRTWNVGAFLSPPPGHAERIPTAAEALRRFLRTIPAEWGLGEEGLTGPIRSAPIPMGMNRRPLAVPGMLVVGDAAGMVNPFTGEGIGYALESGEWAAQLVSEAVRSGRPEVALRYPRLLEARYGTAFRAGRRFVRAIGHPAIMRAGSFGIRAGPVARWGLRAMALVGDERGPAGRLAGSVFGRTGGDGRSGVADGHHQGQ